MRTTDIDRLGDEIAELAAHLDAATHRLFTLIRRFDESGGWADQGALSCAHWLSWRVGLELGAAREHVRVARALAGLPLADVALSRGEISYSKVRALTRVATPATEAALLDMARSSTASQLERICRGYRRAMQNAANERPTYYPQFEQTIRQEAARMADHYEIFYCLEKSIRRLIEDTFEAAKEPNWWDTSRAPAQIKADTLARIQREIDSGVTPRSSEPLDFTNFGELGEIIKANWASSAPYSVAGRQSRRCWRV